MSEDICKYGRDLNKHRLWQWQAEEKIHPITLPPRKMCPHPNPWNIKMLSHVDEVFEGVIRLRILR